ncbi:MAG: hypothetical protein KJ042_04115 [Deltaproteobacteria bacterium]|nr:hypothetical protein [Deltaproteobacteria bacterium]
MTATSALTRFLAMASLVTALLYGCAKTGPGSELAPAAPGMPNWAHRDSNDCAACHPSIVAEWRQTMHARSTADADPLYALMVEKAVETLGPQARASCARCHYPEWKDAALAANLPIEGVSCVVCHRIHPQHPKKSLDTGALGAFARSKEGMSGAQGLCLACHGEMSTPDGRPICTTGAESANGKASCVDCHMPIVKGEPATGSKNTVHRQHAFPGGYSAEFVKGSASLAIRTDDEADELTVVLEVKRMFTGHDLPTGNPMRHVVLRVEAFDANDEEIWSNIADDPLEDDPGAVFQRVFADAAGHRPVPPFASSGPAQDTRLRAGETRELRYAVPPETQVVRAWLEYRLGPEALLTKAGLPEEHVLPKIITKAELDLGAEMVVDEGDPDL